MPLFQFNQAVIQAKLLMHGLISERSAKSQRCFNIDMFLGLCSTDAADSATLHGVHATVVLICCFYKVPGKQGVYMLLLQDTW